MIEKNHFPKLYHSLNRISSYTKDGITTVYEYDSRNNLISETDGTNTKTFEYGGDNRLYKVTENGEETIYEYDLKLTMGTHIFRQLFDNGDAHFSSTF